MFRSMPLSLVFLLALSTASQAAESKPAVKRFAVIPAIPAAAGGPRLPDPRAAVAADSLGRALSQVKGIVVSNASATYHAAVVEGGVGGTSSAVAAKVARHVEAGMAILVEIGGKDNDIQMVATPVLSAGEGGKAPARISQQGAAGLGTDFFNIQSDFVYAVLKGLGIKPTDEEKSRINLVLRATASPTAFDAYALARQQMPVATLEAYDYSVNMLKSAVAKDPEFALAHAALAEAATLLSMQQALTGLRDEQLSMLAVKSAERAVALRPELPDTHRALALACTLVQSNQRAASEAQAALAIRADDPQANLWLGLASGNEGKASIRKALDLDPGAALGHLFLAILAAGEGDQKLMQTECERALALSPLDPSPLLLIGLVQTSDGRVDEAIATYQKVIKINPRTALAYGAVGRLYFRKGETDQARSALQQAYALDPRVFNMMREQATAYRQAGQWEDAEKEYRLILLADEKDTPSWRGLGTLSLDRNKLAEAEKSFRTALQISPKDAWAFIGLSTCHQRQGKDEEALQDLRRAAEVQPEEGFVYQYLGQAYEQRNRLREALEAYDKAVEHSKLLLDAAYHRAQVQEKVDAARAPAAWKAYLEAVDAGGGPRTDADKERYQTAQQRAR